MRIYIILSLVLIPLISCTLNRSSSTQEVKIIEINSRTQIFTPQLMLEVIENTVKIAFNGNQRLYIIPRIKVEEQNILNSDGKIVGTKGVYTDTNYIAFAWNVGDSIGLKYDDIDNFQERGAISVKVDSVISNLGFSANDFKAFSIDLPLPASVIDAKGKRIEKYALPKRHISEVDSIYRYYDKRLKNIDFSFSKKFDDQKESKLYKTTYIWNKLPKGVFLPDVEVPRREGYYEMVISSDNNIERLMELFKKAKADREIKLKLN